MSFMRMFLPVGLAVLLHVVAPERLYVNVKGTMADETSQEPELNGCANGSRNLTGDLWVAEAGLDFAEDCTLIGAAGTRIRLDGPISGKKLTLVGDLQFHATRSFDKACLSVDILHVDGTILVEDCKNNQVSAGEPGGGASAHGVHVTEKGNLTFRNCSTKTRGGGLAAGDKGVEVKGGVLRFDQCMAEQKGGGLSVVAGNINQSNGVLEFMDCGATGGGLKGGGLALENGSLTLKDANVSVEGCQADAGGGFFLENGDLRQDGRHLYVGRCVALNSGGGILVHGGQFSLKKGIAEFTHCIVKGRRYDQDDEEGVFPLHDIFSSDSSDDEEEEEEEDEDEDEDDEKDEDEDEDEDEDDDKEEKEGKEDRDKHQTKHNLQGRSFLNVHTKTKKSSASELHSVGLGGGLWVEKGQVDQQGGDLNFSSCSSYQGGGLALSRGTIRQRGGVMSFHKCTAEQNGGGMFVDHGSGAFGEGHLSFMLCSTFGVTTPTGGGLAIYHGNLTVKDEVQFQECTAFEGGGISLDQSNLTQHGGRLQISKCEAVVEGGGLSVREGQLNQEGGNMKFLNCNSRHGGGVGLERGRIRQHGGSMLFGGCTADHNGGGVLSRTGQTLFKGNVSFTDCRAVGHEGGGMALLHSSLTVEDAEVHIHECTAPRGGGISMIRSNASQRGGLLHVDHCAADWQGGGIFLRSGNLWLISGSMKVENAVVLVKYSSKKKKKKKRKPVISKNPFKKGMRGGGGLWVERGQVDQYGGDFSFLHCSSFFGGGMALSRGTLRQHGGSMSFHYCIAESYGGGINAAKSHLFFKANLSFSSCRASGADGGGAMAVFDNASLTSEQAEVRVHNCSAMKGGGFSIAQSSFTQHGGQLQLHHCSASDQGGGFFLKSCKFEVRGTILVDTCSATSGGGGIFLEDHVQFHVYENITFSNCRQVGTPSGFGGGLEVHNSDIVQSGGNVVFDGCESAGIGGAAYVHKSRWKQVAGALKVANCTAHGETGGGFSFSTSHLEQFRGEMLFLGCSSQSYGGGLDLRAKSSLTQVGGSIQLQSCEAKNYGGCLTMFEGLSFDANGTMSFLNCKSRTRPALYVETNRVTLSTVVVSDGASSDASDLIPVYTTGSLHVKKLEVQNVRERNFAMSAAAITVHDPFDCQTANQSCLFYAPSVRVPQILCPSGTGLTHVHGEFDGCNVCDRQHMQLKASASVPCTRCPDEGTKRCEPRQIEMQKGFMVEVLNSDINDLKVHHCLNPKACPGGWLPHSASKPMCTPGYMGKACLFCEAMHATSDADVLSCVKCASTFWMKTSQFCWIIMKDVLIFLIAYRGGLEAVDSSGKQKDSKTSSILLNQFMAFGSVASIAVLAALNTGG